MAPTPHRVAHTSTELKKLHKKNGPRLNERQQKQLERDIELDQRAAHAREAEERRKAAKKKREEKEAKEAAARKQMGIGLATQLIGYSRTQAQLKNGMEAFLGLKKRKEEEKRKKEEELTKKLEAIAEDIEKEPWDDDDDNDNDIALDFPVSNTSFGEQWADDDLDDDSLLQAHDLIMSDPVEKPRLHNLQPPPVPVPSVIPPPTMASTSPKPVPVKADINFTRTHGPTNKTIEAILDKLPGPLIEILSQDMSLNIPMWDPAEGLLYKLNPAGIPSHRLRIKVGCIVTLLRDLDTSSQLSKSQHLRVLRSENDRLECLVLDGQLEGTKTVLTRVPFVAKYRGLDQHPYRRTQFPIRVATDYTPSNAPRDTSQTGFKMPSVPGRVPSESLPRKSALHIAKTTTSANLNLVFKLPGLPASKSSSLVTAKSISITKPAPAPVSPPIDCWDDFLDSSTQISRDLAADVAPKPSEPTKAPVIAPSTLADGLPPMSTQDFDFSMDDLDEELNPKAPLIVTARAEQDITKAMPVPLAAKPLAPKAVQKTIPTVSTALPAKKTAKAGTTANSSKPLRPARKIAGRCLNPGPFATGIEAKLAKLRPSQLPKSMDGPWKRKSTTAPPQTSPPPAKNQRVLSPRTAVLTDSVAVSSSKGSFEEFMLSTQEAACFFDDDDDFGFGSPPIAA
ncbi:ATP-dependent DNA helicase PIF1-like [Pyrenophora tritici-repentis]|nr:ATP-dependent DNA helicase PIF1-like [Pyrenophora tritici-repentis]KAI1592288.1 ATP-dependent DNA helicase PIF1-like [Pyrenophora tritici-repentis]